MIVDSRARLLVLTLVLYRQALAFSFSPGFATLYLLHLKTKSFGLFTLWLPSRRIDGTKLISSAFAGATFRVEKILKARFASIYFIYEDALLGAYTH